MTYKYPELDIDKKTILDLIDERYLHKLKEIGESVGKSVMPKSTTEQTYLEAIKRINDKDYAKRFPGLYVAEMRMLQSSFLNLTGLNELGLFVENADEMPALPDTHNRVLRIASLPTMLQDDELSQVIAFEQPTYSNGDSDWQRQTDRSNAVISLQSIPIQVLYEAGQSMERTVLAGHRPVFKYTS